MWAWHGGGQTHEMMTPYALFGLLAAEEAGYPCPNPNTIPNGMARLRQYLDATGTQWDAALKVGCDKAFAKQNDGTKRGDRRDSTKDAACVLYALCDYLVAVQAGPAATGVMKMSLNGSASGELMRVTAAPGSLQFFLIESPKPSGCETVAAGDRRFPVPLDSQGHVLREDREAMSCFHYESAGVAAAEFVVLAEFAGEFVLPPARGELMYQPTSGGHSDSFVLKVTPKK